MTDILYVLKRDESGTYDDFRMSLRSISMNMLHVGNVYLVGAIPDWVNQNEVRCIPHDDAFRPKHKNILDCIMYAVEHSDIGKTNEHGMFMLSSDDHWYVRETNAMWDGKFLFKGGLMSQKDFLRKEASHEKVNNYDRSIASTCALLESKGFPQMNFARHENTWMSREVMRGREWKSLCYDAQHIPAYGCEPTALMCNFILARHPEWIYSGILFMKDYKAGVECQVSDVTEEIESSGRNCISGSDGACGGKLSKWLHSMFDEKCKYEK